MRQKQPKISIVMPSFNQAHFIEEAIESVLQQDYPNFELIVVDGLSTDGTIEKLKQYEGHPQIAKIIIEKDKGQSDALAKGFKLCTGQILAWLNSDDVYAPGAFQHIASLFEQHQDCHVINGELNVIDEKSEWVSLWPRRTIKEHQWMHFPQPIGQPSTFFTSEIYRKVGGVNAVLRYAMDYDLFFRFVLAGANFHYTNNVLANFRVHDSSKTMSLPYKFWKEEIQVFYRLSNRKIVSGFYYWKFRGILGLLVRQYILKSRRF